MEQKRKKIKLEFKLQDIQKLSFFEENYRKYGLNSKDIIDCNFVTTLQIEFNDSERTVSFIVGVRASDINNKNNVLFGLTSLFKFVFRSLHKFKLENHKYNIPDDLMTPLFNMAISGTRGMLAILLDTPEYKKLYLPPISAKDLLFGLKTRLKETKSPSLKEVNN